MNQHTGGAKAEASGKNENIVKSRLFKVSDYFDENNAFIAVRQGMIMTIPLLVVGSMALMLKSLPVPAYQEILPKLLDGRLVEIFSFIQSAAFSLLAVAIALATSFCYGKIKVKDEKADSGDCVIVMLITIASLAGYSGIQYDDFSVTKLGNTNIFAALAIALFTGWFYFKIKEKGFFKIRQRGMEADSLYSDAVSGIMSALLIVGIFAVIRQQLELIFHVESIQELLEIGVNSLFKQIGNGLGIALILLLLIHGMWFVGIHGNNVLGTIMQQNFVVISAGTIYSKTFQDVFVIMGGTGSILCLVIAILLFSKKSGVRNIAKLSLPTVIFNISEIISFGLPVILNPIFFIPYMLVPVVNCVIAYGAISLGLVPHVVRTVEWTSPVFLSGYQATGSIAGSILQAVCLCVGVIIYLPFLRMFEERDGIRLIKNVKELVLELQRQEESKNFTSLTGRSDSIGNVARVLAADLKEAVKNKKLFLLYQPQVDREGKCIGGEAMLRWKHPIAGAIYPPLIIRLAKEENMLRDIEEYLFDESACAISKIGKEIDRKFKISVNITNASLAWEGFESCMADRIEKYHIPPEKLWLEVTEQEALVFSDEIVDKICRIRERGHKFLIDDFGMGHTSLVYLQTNYFEIVKLDGSLTRDVLINNRNNDIIESIVNLGKSLNFQTVAEYVETREQRDKLAELGCDIFQGYLYSKPIELNEFIKWMKEH